MASTRNERSTPRRRSEVLRLLRGREHPMGITDIARSLGVHANTVRFHLETLVDDGLVERTTVAGGRPGRPRQLFAAVLGMDPTGPRHYRMLAEVLAASLAGGPDPGPRAVDAGRRWGHRQGSAAAATAATEPGAPVGADESIDRLVGVLDELGFAPELLNRPEPLNRPAPLADAGLPEIGLHHCPFLELAVTQSDVVCPLHLGIMRGVLESAHSSVTVDRLETFARPDLCTAHLAPAGTS